ncbi:MAG: hypothetical protein ABSA85_18160 [Terracidiphilus sp.]
MFTFIESGAFNRMRANYLNDDEYRELQEFSDVEPGRGSRRFGFRWCAETALTLYAKTKRENAPAHILKKLKEAFGND